MSICNAIVPQTSYKNQLVFRRASCNNLKLWNQAINFLGGKHSEFWTLDSNTISEDTTLAGNILGGEDIVTSQHSDSDSSIFTLLHTCRNFRPQGVFDTHYSNQGEILVNFFLILDIIAFGLSREVTVSQAESTIAIT